MEKEYHKGPGLTMANLGLSLEELNDQPLELRILLQHAS